MQSREPTNSTHISRPVWESNPSHIGGRRVLSPLRHPCSPCTPLVPPSCFISFVLKGLVSSGAYLHCFLYRGICSTDKTIKNLIQPLIPPLANGYAKLYKEQKDFETLKRCDKEEFFGLRDFYRYKIFNFLKQIMFDSILLTRYYVFCLCDHDVRVIDESDK